MQTTPSIRTTGCLKKSCVAVAIGTDGWNSMAVIRRAPIMITRPMVHSTAPRSRRLRSDSGCFISSLRNAIPQAADRLDDRRTELAPQTRDEHFNGVRVAVEILRVNMLGQLAL